MSGGDNETAETKEKKFYSKTFLVTIQKKLVFSSPGVTFPTRLQQQTFSEESGGLHQC